MVANYSLTFVAGNGGSTPPGYPISANCAMGIAGAAWLILNPPTGAVRWVISSVVTGWGLGACPG